jgi:hypothetical protein
VAELLWPAFVERNGVIFLGFVKEPTDGADRHSSITQYERFHSHTHIQDIVQWTVPTVHDVAHDLERPDSSSPGFHAAWTFPKQLAAMWLAKPMQDVPSHEFRVYGTKVDDPIVHFHRIRRDEPAWLTDGEARDAVARAELLVLDSRHVRPNLQGI